MNSDNIINRMRKKNVKLVEKLIKIGKSLSLENDIKKIFNIILSEMMEFTSADKGIIYITSENEKELRYEIVRSVSQNFNMDAEQATDKWKTIQLYSVNNEPVMNSLATFVYHTGFEAHFDDVYGQDYFQIDLIKEMDEKTNYHSRSMVAIPLVDHEENVLGIIELTNSISPDGSIVPFQDNHIDVLLSVASQAAITLSNKILVNSLEKMIFDFTQAVAYAIDMKSVNSYKHVQNVANITNILAREINSVDFGKYANTAFSPDELEEIAISGWLHDLGKITTPDCILNKHTKLQALYDRINVLKLRFELLETVISFKLSGKISDEERNRLMAIKDRLPEYKDFLIQINTSQETLTEDMIDKIYEISAVLVTYNNSKYRLLDSGELESLLVRSGNLTNTEYTKIKEHAQSTYEILKNIKFPKKFKNVPRIASLHHERLNGNGYPHGLKNSEIPLQSRILAIADVFDALMSKRSYKKDFNIEKSLSILAGMAKNGEIDKDLMDIIIKKKIYREFARFYDNVDINEKQIKKLRNVYLEKNA